MRTIRCLACAALLCAFLAKDRPAHAGLLGDAWDWVTDKVGTFVGGLADIIYDCGAGALEAGIPWLDVPANGSCWDSFTDVWYELAGREVQDCRDYEAPHNDDALARACVKASDYAGGCVPRSEFVTWDCLELDADAELCDDDQPFNMTVHLMHDGVSIDCNGQLIDHGWEDGGSSRAAFRAPYTRSVSNIVIENCVVTNVGKSAFDFHRFYRGADAHYPLAPGHQNITVRSSVVINAGQKGAFVGHNSRGIVFEDVVIAESGFGIYLEAESSYNVLRRVHIRDSEKGAGLQIDASHHNLIEHSSFLGNAEGGILMYKNCGERFGQICPINRRSDASYNTLRYNDFYERVSVADRQFRWHPFNWCAGIEVNGYWRDHSAHNVVYGNQFHDGARLSVRDSPNTIYDNLFTDGSLSIGERNPLGDDPIHFSGWVAENVFATSEPFDLVGAPSRLDDVDFYNNWDGAGACHRDYVNVGYGTSGVYEPAHCDGDSTLLWGEQVVSAGLAAALF